MKDISHFLADNWLFTITWIIPIVIVIVIGAIYIAKKLIRREANSIKFEPLTLVAIFLWMRELAFGFLMLLFAGALWYVFLRGMFTLLSPLLHSGCQAIRLCP